MKRQVFVQGPLLCIDLVNPHTGRSETYGHTLEQVQKEYPGAEIADLETWSLAKEQALCTEPERIDEDRFIEMLEVLPPQRWQMGRRANLYFGGEISGENAESFELSEHTSGRITLVCVRIGNDYFQYQTVAGQKLSAHIERCQKAQVPA